MRKKIMHLFSYCIAFLLFITQINVYATDTKENSTSDDKENKNVVLEYLTHQTNGLYNSEDVLNFVVEINEKTMNEKYKLEAPDIENVGTKIGLLNQIEYAKKSQNIVLDALDDLGINYQVTEKYDTVLNGFVIKMKLKDAKSVATLEEIKLIEVDKFIKMPTVSLSKIYKTRDASSNNMINALEVWQKQFTGKGQLIAVIDSGADENHEIFSRVNDEDSLKIKTQEELNELKNISGITNGKFFNQKIPFGYNYANNNNKINNTSSHGLHVAGIIAGNSDVIQGVVPDAQLAIMKVFGDASLGTTHSLYNKAIDDAVKLGVDAINMSLGTTGTTDSRIEKTTYEALLKAQKAGIAVAIAVGNDGFMGFGAISGPKAYHIDYGVVNSPSTLDVSISVASVDNEKIYQEAMYLENLESRKLRYMVSGNNIKFDDNQLYELVEAGFGYEEDFESKNILGKVVVISRGDKSGEEARETTFLTKIKNAQDKGAVGVIIYNHLDESSLVNMAGLDGITIPSVFVSKDDGLFILENINNRLKFDSNKAYVHNPNGYNISEFSSWGMTPEGNLKPDISAPGGGIYSSINQGYKIDNGTSMATPHVSGGIAVVKQYVEQNFPNIIGKEKQMLIKNILMSSATPRLDEDEQAYLSPRGQGAGLLNLDAATNTSVVILGTNEISSINLGNIESNIVNISGKLKNYSSEIKNYNYYVVLSTDKVEDGIITLKPELIESTKNNKQNISVQGNAEENFSISLTIPQEKIDKLYESRPNGFFLEGYVIFEGANGTQDISIPFVGVKGAWSNSPVIEDSIYDLILKNQTPYYYEKITDVVKYPFTHIGSKFSGEEIALGELPENTFENPKFQKNKIAFSPNGDGKADYASFIGTFLRNYKDFEMSIYREDDKTFLSPIFSISDKTNGIKNFDVMSMLGPQYTTTRSNWKWDGKNANEELQLDGKYLIVINAKLDGFEEKSKPIILPITLDTVFPRIVKSSYNQDNGEFILEEVEEKGSGIREVYIMLDEQKFSLIDGKIKLPDGTNPADADLFISDFAFNTLKIPLENAIRTGEERVVIVKANISSGSVSDDKFVWKVLNENNEEVNPYNLEIGKYRLVISEVNEIYELLSDEIIEFEIANDDKVKVIDVEFAYKNKRAVTIEVINNRNASMRVLLIDKISGKEYEFSKKVTNPSIYIANAPAGEYKLVVRDLEEGYAAIISKEDLIVGENGFDNASSVTIRTIKKLDITVNVNRNGYQGPLKVVFVGNDSKNSRFELEFVENEISKNIQLPIGITFDVYTKDIINSEFASEIVKETFSFSKKSVDVILKEGIKNNVIPVNKDILKIKINQANALNEENYKSGWDILEIALEKAEKILKSEDTNQVDIDNAVQELQDAINNLEEYTEQGDKKKLKEKIEEAEKILRDIVADEYTEESLQFLQIVVEAGKIVLESDEPNLNTQEHIDSIINNIDSGISNLKRKDGKIDKSNLKALIDTAEEILGNESLYKADTLQGLKDTIDLAKEVLLDENASFDDVQSMVETLRNNIDFVETNTDKTLLEEELRISEELDLKLYKYEGKESFRDAKEKAKNVLRNIKATEQEVEEALNELKLARKNLLLKESVVDKTVLEQKINEASEFKEENYTNSSYQILKMAIDNANIIKEKSDATEEEVQNAIADIDNAISNLVAKEKISLPTVDKKLLEEELRKSKSIDLTKYEETNKNNFIEAIRQAESILSNMNSTQEEVNNIILALQNEKSKLVEKQIAQSRPSPVASSPISSGGGGGVSSQATTKIEVKKTNTEKDRVSYFKGYEDNTFRPNTNITRAEAFVLLEKFLSNDNMKKSNFVDVKKDIWYLDAVNKLLANEVLIFTGEKLEPNKELTRAELVAMIVKIKGIIPTGNTNFRDKGDATWANGYIAIAQKEGWIRGYEDNTFRPNANITRAEISKIISIAFNIKQSEKEILFKDITKEHWAYKYISSLV